MANILWAIILWALVFILIPVERIKRLWKVALVAVIWLFFIDYNFIHLGYYRFYKDSFAVAGIPIFYLLGGAAGGMILINWFPRNPLYKIISIVVFSLFIKIAESAYMLYGYFAYLNNFTALLSFTLNIAGLSLLVWFSFAIIGEEEIYFGAKTRFNKESNEI